MKLRRSPLNIDVLEDRLSPATLGNPATMLFTDVDGDCVQVTVNRGVLTRDHLTFAARGMGEQLQTMCLGNEFAGADLGIKVIARGKCGDGLVNVGFIDASGIDLGNVFVQGDVGRILTGDNNGATPALAKLGVNSLGHAGVGAQEPDGSLESVLVGSVGEVRVNTDVNGASFFVINADETSTPTLGSLTIGGSLRGNQNAESGVIHCNGAITRVTIGGSICGGDGDFSGAIRTMYLGRLYVGRDIVSGAGESSGSVVANQIGDITVAGSLKGTAAQPVHISALSLVKVVPRIEYREEQRVVRVNVELPDGTIRQEARVITVTVEYTNYANEYSLGRVGSVTVLGSVTRAEITAGINGGMGSVFVRGDWTASNLVAGVSPGDDGQFGTPDDGLYVEPSYADADRIHRIVIVGRIRGTSLPGDHFGFVARQIGQFINGFAWMLPLQRGPGNDDFLVSATADVRVREVAGVRMVEA